jgi:hypothetical protein
MLVLLAFFACSAGDIVAAPDDQSQLPETVVADDEPSAAVMDTVPGAGWLHPDGQVGRMSLSGSVRYITRYSDHWSGGRDYQIYHGAFTGVVHPRFTVHGDYRLYDFDGRRHEMAVGLTYYSVDPMTNRAADSVNADGPLDGPVFTARFGARFYNTPDSNAATVFELGAVLPLSTRLTLSAGYIYREDIRPDDAVSGYAGVSVYFADYATERVWENPDGPPGRPVLDFLAGVSSQGAAGEVAARFPLNPTLTLTGLVGLAFLDDRDVTAYTAGLRFTVYFKQ